MAVRAKNFVLGGEGSFNIVEVKGCWSNTIEIIKKYVEVV